LQIFLTLANTLKCRRAAIMGKLFGAGPSLPYQERVERVRSAGIELWDSLQGIATRF
jgi:hypothetical protein